MPMLIAGIGTAVPPHRIAQADAAEIAQQYSCETPAQERLFKGMYRRAGVETRHSVVLRTVRRRTGQRGNRFTRTRTPRRGDRMRKYEEHAGALAVSAATGSARRRGDRSGAGHAPGHRLVQRLLCPGLRHRPDQATGPGRRRRSHSRWLHGLPRAAQRPAGGAGVPRRRSATACVLLCAVEMCSLHHQYGWNSERIVANALFADGAAAVAWRFGAAIIRIRLPGRCVGLDADRRLRRRHVLADRRSRLRDDAFTARPRADQPTPSGRISTAGWRGQGMTLASVGSWAVHPGGPRILAAFGEATGLDRRLLEPLLPGPGRVRQHVVADGPLHSRTTAPDQSPPALRGPGVRAWPGGRGGVAGMIAEGNGG